MTRRKTDADLHLQQMDDIENIRSCYIERREMQTHDPRD